MEAGRELVGTRPREDGPASNGQAKPLHMAPSRAGRGLTDWQWAVVVYLVTRLLYMGVAVASHILFGSKVPTETLSGEFHNWDGNWYLILTQHGYPRYVTHQQQSTLGFFPLFSMVIWGVSHLFRLSYVVAGMLISGIGGLIGTLLIQRLAVDWWGREYARKAVLIFCVFPGSIIFSMVYSEGLLIPLVAGCLYALSRKRWLLAGILAGFATGIGPDSFVIIPTCATASLMEFHKRGLKDWEAWKSLIAPILSPFGAAAFALFLWFWTGSPLASYIAQRQGWGEKTTILSIPAWFHSFYLQAAGGFHHVDFNVPVAVAGTFFLAFGLLWLIRYRQNIPLYVGVFVAGMTFLMITSRGVPPNPRLLLTTFPVVIVYARRLKGWGWWLTIGVCLVLLVVLSSLTYMASLLRP